MWNFVTAAQLRGLGAPLSRIQVKDLTGGLGADYELGDELGHGGPLASDFVSRNNNDRSQ